ncbi:malate dehydrogenase [Fusarium oxysporum f. sp. raphani]|nr:malate dehydrogenase [Fusarium oxysporum f. sp. raphani]
MVKAVVAGASGGIGQPLSLLLKTSPHIDELALYDVVNTPGVATDLSHISSRAKTTGYLPANDGAKAAFKDADIIVIPAGIPRKPGMTRDDLFNINAGIVKGLIEVAAEVAPKAFILVISNPVNSTVPIAAEVLKAKGVFNPQRLFGVTTLDIVRAETFVAEITGRANPQELTIPVIGGHSGETIVPLFSKASPAVQIPEDKYDALVNRVQFGGDEVVKAKDGAGSATLSMAYAGFRFAEKVLRAVKGEKGLVEPSYVYLPGVSGGGIPGGEAIAKETGTDFFSVPIELGPNGAEKATNPLEGITEKEKALLAKATEGLKGNISKGVSFVHNPPQKLPDIDESWGLLQLLRVHGTRWSDVWRAVPRLGRRVSWYYS